MIRILTLITTVTVVSACAVPVRTTQVINLENEFDIRAAQAQTESGNGTVWGSAFMHQRNGNVVTCANNDVYLVPATDYAKERHGHVYADMPTATSTSLKRVDQLIFRPQKFFPDPPEYYLATKTTTCDEQGNFQFVDVKDGDYFVNASVYWTEENWEVETNEGGSLARRVTVANGIAPQVVLTP